MLYISASSWLFNVRQKDIAMSPPGIEHFDLEDTGRKTGCYRSCIRDDWSVSH